MLIHELDRVLEILVADTGNAAPRLSSETLGSICREWNVGSTLLATRKAQEIGTDKHALILFAMLYTEHPLIVYAGRRIYPLTQCLKVIKLNDVSCKPVDNPAFSVDKSVDNLWTTCGEKRHPVDKIRDYPKKCGKPSDFLHTCG